jgi:hypothetical protein
MVLGVLTLCVVQFRRTSTCGTCLDIVHLEDTKVPRIIHMHDSNPVRLLIVGSTVSFAAWRRMLEVNHNPRKSDVPTIYSGPARL